jgi:sulfite reductase alpha subunit-like flavoprotein
LRDTYSRKNPILARLLTNRLLNAAGSGKEVRHCEISLAGSGLSYEVGDALGVVPTNCGGLVVDILAALGCGGEEAVKTPDGSETSLRLALAQHYEIARPSPICSKPLQNVVQRAANWPRCSIRRGRMNSGSVSGAVKSSTSSPDWQNLSPPRNSPRC